MLIALDPDVKPRTVASPSHLPTGAYQRLYSLLLPDGLGKCFFIVRCDMLTVIIVLFFCAEEFSYGVLHINPGDGNSIVPAFNLGCRYFSAAAEPELNMIPLREDYLRALGPVATDPYRGFMHGTFIVLYCYTIC